MNSILVQPKTRTPMNGMFDSNINQSNNVGFYPTTVQWENPSNNMFTAGGAMPIVAEETTEDLPEISQPGAGSDQIVVHNPENIQAVLPGEHDMLNRGNKGSNRPPRINAGNAVKTIWTKHKNKVLIGGGLLTLGGVVLYASQKKKKAKKKGLNGIQTESGTKIS